EHESRSRRLDCIMRKRRHIEARFVQAARPLGVIAALRQESDDVHPAIGGFKQERKVGACEQVEKERVPCRVFSAAATNVRVKGAALEKESERGLIEQRQMIIAEVLQLDELIEQRVGYDHVAKAQRGEEKRAGGAGVQ